MSAWGRRESTWAIKGIMSSASCQRFLPVLHRLFSGVLHFWKTAIEALDGPDWLLFFDSDAVPSTQPNAPRAARTFRALSELRGTITREGSWAGTSSFLQQKNHRTTMPYLARAQ